jgi:hypothetical protein
MQLLARAVVTGFGLALGTALYKKLARKVGFAEPEPWEAKREDPSPAVEDGEIVQPTP